MNAVCLPDVGESPAHFASLKGVSDAARTFDYLREHSDLAMICLNDDEGEEAAAQIGEIMHAWLDERWRGRAWWERIT